MPARCDIIGDVHGCADTLKTLLGQLGYRLFDGVYRHAEREAIFIGDLIDRGPGQREVVEMARRMVDAGTAQAVMGNHEYNAIAYSTPDGSGEGHLRQHSPKNRAQHQAFLDAYAHEPGLYAETIAWFQTLPLWLEIDGLRVVHACWDHGIIRALLQSPGGGPFLSDGLLYASSQKGSWQYHAVETLLKGKEIPLPDGTGFHDKEGTLRHNIRVRWWDRGAGSYRQAYMGPERARTEIPDDQIAGDHLVEYAHDAPPVVLGHYWIEGTPTPLAPNIACVDYSVAKPGGKLVAYRWDGEQTFLADKFVAVHRVET